MKVDVILPAGGRIQGSFAEEAGAEVKALIQLRSTSLLEIVVDSVRATGRVNRAVIAGPDTLFAEVESRVDKLLPDAESGPQNIFNGLAWLGTQPHPADHVLILTTDLPFITADSVSGFLDACPADSDICLPLFSKLDFESRFPHSVNSYVRLRDGEWTIGCAFLLRRQALERNRQNIDRIFEARKSPLSLARQLGPFFIARYLTRTLRVPHLEAHCHNLTGCIATAVRGCDPALAFDIDEPSDFHYARDHSKQALEAVRS